jgi:D-arabinose 1-dehydrogenase-like Zn-dependent alcohol dehydrogenase
MSSDRNVMECLWLEQQHLTLLENVPVPVPDKYQALIRVALAGVCNTDLELLRGYYPFSGIPGHEFVGRVVSSPADPTWTGLFPGSEESHLEPARRRT